MKHVNVSWNSWNPGKCIFENGKYVKIIVVKSVMKS